MGVRKLRAELIRRGLSPPPATSTVYTVLKRHGLVGPRRRRPGSTSTRFERTYSNDQSPVDGIRVALADGMKVQEIDIPKPAGSAIAASACRRATRTMACSCLDTAIAAFGADHDIDEDNATYDSPD